ncbi:MAG: hypothetical protein LQ343_007195 [Gyalolechia ehrenbergii]|nr:MAG: hypothetical protein LQ343_007195 [Gyalolechia ehrenbergii]
MPSANGPTDLPDSASPTLRLVQANEAEMIESSTMNADSWRGSLDVNAYLEREAHLRNTNLNRNGGITYWILVDTAASPTVEGVRRILASCETLRKRALVARSDGHLWEIISHGIGSVYCNPAFRGRGYAQRMLAELAKILDTWQQKEGACPHFTVLWSDIEDIEDLCTLDEALLRSAMAKPASSERILRVALIPDAATMQWHHAREEFLGERLRDRFPFTKGATVDIADGRRAWCIWTRTFGVTRDDDVLNILRLVVEEEKAVDEQAMEGKVDEDQAEPEQGAVAAVAAILEQAQLEASFWGMSSVQLWNPSPLTFKAAMKIEPSAILVDRDDESITSLRWHGKVPPDDTKIDWIANEKYAWC